MQANQLIEEAKKASKKAYAPYSNIHVGCAIETEDGEIITGANIENRSYGLTICAERTAIFSAVLKQKKIKTLAIYSPDVKKALYPCGACRQVMTEFMETSSIILCYDPETNKIIKESLKRLLPGEILTEIKPNKES